MEERSFLASDLLQCAPAPQSSLTSHTGIQTFGHPEKRDRAAQTRPSTGASTGTSAVTDQGLGMGHNSHTDLGQYNLCLFLMDATYGDRLDSCIHWRVDTQTTARTSVSKATGLLLNTEKHLYDIRYQIASKPLRQILGLVLNHISAGRIRHNGINQASQQLTCRHPAEDSSGTVRRLPRPW